MDKLEGLLANPFLRILLGVGVLFALSGPIISTLQAIGFQVGIFESLFFERWWNLPRISWLVAILLTAGWVAGGLSLKFDPVSVIIAAGIFLFWSVIITNLYGDLPEIVRTLFVVLRAVITIGGVLVGGLGLFTAMKAGQPLTGASLTGMADAVRPPAAASPTGPGPTPASATGVGTTTASGAAGSTPAGWFPDPKQEAAMRYWDGTQWTDHTN